MQRLMLIALFCAAATLPLSGLAASVAQQEFADASRLKPNAEHGLELVPRLAGQHYGYLLREMHDAVEGRRPNFSLTHIRLLQKLDRDDFVGLADFLSRANPAREAPRKSRFP
jgi:hypothetical protein